MTVLVNINLSLRSVETIVFVLENEKIVKVEKEKYNKNSTHCPLEFFAPTTYFQIVQNTMHGVNSKDSLIVGCHIKEVKEGKRFAYIPLPA